MSFYAYDMDRMQVEDDEARAEYHRDRAAESPVGCGCPEWCEFYMVSIGAPGCGETFPRCELMRDLWGTT